MVIDAGPPGRIEKGAYKRNPYVKETALPEPQMIKQTVLWRFFQACDKLAKINRFRRISTTKAIPEKFENELQEEVEWLFLFLSSKQNIQDWPDFKEIQAAIIGGNKLPHTKVCEIVVRLGDALQELGITKIEYLKQVDPAFAYHEGEILGEY